MNIQTRPSTGAASASVRPVASMERRRLRLYLLLLVGDVCLITLAFAAAGTLYLGQFAESRAMLAAYLLLPLYLTIALYNGTYSLGSIERWLLGAKRMLLAAVISAALMNFITFFARASTELSRGTFATGFVICLLLLALWRLLVDRMIRQRFVGKLQNTLVIDAKGPEIAVPGAYFLDGSDLDIAADVQDPAALNFLGSHLRNMDRVIVSCPMEDRADWSLTLKSSGVAGEIASEHVRAIGALGVEHHDEHNFSTLIVSRGPLGMRDRAIKRAFDLGLSTIALIVLALPLLLVALAVRLESSGPVLFRQRRLGRGNRYFDILKFRTMRHSQRDADGTRSAGRDDDRITPLGRMLRRTSVDELPQLVNIWLGHMSFVGPRPHAIGSQAGHKLFWQVDRRYWQRHALRPGLTGLAQVRGLRGATDTEEALARRLQSDLEYIDGWNIWRDAAILIRTLFVLKHERAF